MGFKVESITPHRISFVGGGTDIAWFYKKYGGEVISTAIDKYVRVEVKEFYPNRILINDETQGLFENVIVGHIDKISNPYVRAILKRRRIDNISITISSDIPPGSGLGGSSALTVGLLNALVEYLYQRGDAKHTLSCSDLAVAACGFEIEDLGAPIGKQDQYIAAYGGFRRIKFNKDDTVKVKSLVPPKELEESLMLFDTGIRRESNPVLKDQHQNVERGKVKERVMCDIKSMVHYFKNHMDDGEIMQMGRVLNNAWGLKRSLASSTSTEAIDEMYEKAYFAGAYGGKLLGAGGGGHLLFLVYPSDNHKIIEALDGMATHVPFKFDTGGTRISLEKTD